MNVADLKKSRISLSDPPHWPKNRGAPAYCHRTTGPMLMILEMKSPNRDRTVPANARQHWIDSLKAIALLWIFLDHASERMFGLPLLGNPDDQWPSLHARVFQLAPMRQFGALNLPANLFRYVGWLGDLGVGLFLLLSGFALVWSCLNRGDQPLAPREFYRRRLSRIYPMWIIAHLGMLFLPGLFGVHVSLIDPQLYWSLLGIRILPDQFYYGWSAWWFIGLILQLYLIFPILYRGLQRLGPTAFLLVTVSIALVIRAAGLFYFTSYLDCWCRGAIFITRLPEFVAGMALAVWMRQGAGRKWSSLPAMLLGLLSLGVGTAASVTLAGMTVAPLLQSVGLFAIFFPILSRGAAAGISVEGSGLERAQPARARNPLTVLEWIGRHSLSLYLVHEPFVRALTHRADSSRMLLRDWAGCIVAMILAGIAAIILERVTDVAIACIHRAWHSPRRGSIGVGFASAVVLIWAGLVAAELHVRRTDPQEASDLGWGERPSLRPDAVFGWNLQPDRTTRLRWQSYDYRVTANHLGFPGPDFPVKKPAGVYRVLVTGDAFTSAEGVDTNLAWPRLLEHQLADRTHRPTQVMNFAVTGYGPNQYAAVVDTFAPIYHPDLIVIGLFINDYGDVLTSDDEFRRSIGFGKVDPNGIAAVATFRQLASLVRGTAIAKLDHLRHKPDPVGYFLGHFHFLESGCDDETGLGRQLMTDRLREIKVAADKIGARLVIAMIPSGPQVCPPSMLAYWPAGIDLSDTSRFDPDLPQRTTAAIARELSIPCYDLRPPLRAAIAQGNPYQSHNMHWTKLGHRVAAEYLAKVLSNPVNENGREVSSAKESK
jgi:peptidoglycan/LPS O-acetylase OafA/YrhL